MLVDLNHVPERRLASDICVVGTGAAGLTLASVLLRSGASVIMLESGGLEHDKNGQDLNRCETDHILFEGAIRGRKRCLGGSTECWGGQLLPLDPMDFAERPWVDHSGWPISPDDLDPYYRLALRFAGSDDLNFDTDICRALGRDSPFDPSVVRYYFSKWSPHPRFREVLGNDLRQSAAVRVFLHATVTGIRRHNDGRRIKELQVANASRQQFVISADTFVLAAGGIEVPRLLLANEIGNTHDLVGRFFHDHPNVRVGTVRSSDPQHFTRLFIDSSLNGVQVSPRVSLTPAVQEERGFLNASAHIWFRYPRSLLQRLPLLNLANRIGAEPRAARNFLDAGLLLTKPTIKMLRQGSRLGKDARFTLTVVAEQEPCAASRITLGKLTDKFGTPRAKISWHLTEKTWRTVVGVAETLRNELRRAELGELDLFPHIGLDRDYWRVFPLDGYHHMGATRMGKTPESGVVNENCQVWGIDNLFVVGGSVFPTGGHSNCTLTIMALALRLSDHIAATSHVAASQVP